LFVPVLAFPPFLLVLLSPPPRRGPPREVWPFKVVSLFLNLGWSAVLFPPCFVCVSSFLGFLGISNTEFHAFFHRSFSLPSVPGLVLCGLRFVPFKLRTSPFPAPLFAPPVFFPQLETVKSSPRDGVSPPPPQLASDFFSGFCFLINLFDPLSSQIVLFIVLLPNPSFPWPRSVSQLFPLYSLLMLGF